MAEIIRIHQYKESFNEAIKDLSNLCSEDLHSINTLVLEKLDSSVPLIQEIGKYLILSGGKRLRPLLTTSCFHILNSDLTNNINHIGLAAAVEFIHAATLLHDDVVDLSKDRRGKLTANEVWSNKTSVLVGDFLFSRSFQLMTKYGTMETLKILSDTSVIISEGEVLEISNDKNLEMNEDTYFQVINGKTASLFSAACQVGGISGGAKDNEQQALKSFGTNFGMAFQLIDDAIDYSSNSKTMGKNIGDDFRERKLTMPFIKAIQNSTKSELEFWKRTIEKGNQNDQDWDTALSLMDKYQAITKTRQEAEMWVEQAKRALSKLPDSEMRILLSELADYVLTRSK